MLPESITFGVMVALSLARVSFVRNGGESARNVTAVTPSSIAVNVSVATV